MEKSVLINNLKRQVKHVVESSASNRQLSGDGYSVKVLTLAIENCLQHELQKGNRLKSAARWLLEHEASSMDILLLKVSNTSSSSSSEYMKNLVKRSSRLWEGTSTELLTTSCSEAPKSSGHRDEQDFSWVRMALTTNNLYHIVQEIVERASEFYHQNALLRDPVYSEIFLSLIAGPCMLNYSNALFTFATSNEPDARELITRQSLSLKCRQNDSEEDEASVDFDSGKWCKRLTKRQFSLKTAVQSLYHTSSDRMIYAKNNIKIEDRRSVVQAGHLSVIRNLKPSKSPVIQWIPNIVMLAWVLLSMTV
ncbi:hypothetical protein ACOME3_007692 [Neoechinorhynchus agilis]